jgi:polar amino acid transport system substrate-binding protein
MKKPLLIISLISGLWAQALTAQTLTASTVTRTPFSFVENGVDTGFSIELLEMIAETLDWNIEIDRVDLFSTMLATVETREADMAIANISITSSREAVMDYSQPIFEAGLQIMVPSDGIMMPSLMKAMFSADLLMAIAIAFVLLMGGGMMMWWFERRAQPYFDRTASEAWFPSFWWALNLVVNGGFEERVPRTPVGRLFAVLLVLSSLFVVSIFVAKITAVMTVDALNGTVNSVNDLYRQRVATIEESTAAEYLTGRDIVFRAYSGLEPMLKDFEAGKIEAIVFDAPVLSYYASHEGIDFASMAGPVFRRENYGIIFPTDSPLVEDVNLAILSLRENGAYDELYRRWFGNTRN